LTGAAKQLCALLTGTAKTGPIHHSKNFRECAANYIALSNPQKLSKTQEFEHLDYQTAHCKAYIDLFAEDYEYHKHHGGWLTGYVDYGLDNGLNTTPKSPKSPKSPKPPKSSSTKYLMIGGIVVVVILVVMAQTRHN